MKLHRAPLVFSFLVLLLAHFSLSAAPVIDALSPNFGPVAGGTPVTIIGSGFTGALSVQFGDLSASFTVTNDEIIEATAPEAFLSTAVVTVTTASGTSPVSAGSYYAYQGSWMAYLTENTSGSLIPIELSSQTVLSPIPCGASPAGLAITPDGSSIYVCNLLDPGTVTPVTLTGAGTAIPVGTFPRNIAITPDGMTAYVANGGSNNVTPIDIGTNTAGTVIGVGSFPYTLAVTPDGSKAYVLNSADNTITPIALPSNVAGSAFDSAFSSSQGIGITPDNQTAYVSNAMSNTIVPVDVATDAVGTGVVVGDTPQIVAISPNGDLALVSRPAYLVVKPVTLPSTLEADIDFPFFNANTMSGPAIAPDGKTAYVAGKVTSSGGLSFFYPISLDTFTIGTGVQLSADSSINPQTIAITPDPAPIAFFTSYPSYATSESIFDASSSVSSVGTIVSYDWDFGDGDTLNTIHPTANHVYVLPGSYSVTLTVTNSAGTSTTQVFTGQTMSRNGGPSATATQTIEIPNPRPAITGISPNSGPVVGGTSVTINGQRFTGTTEVRFGASLASFSVQSDTSLTAVSPPGTGIVDISVTNDGGTSEFSPNDQFTYFYSLPTVTSLSPASGPDDGGTTVILTGTNFIGASSVSFGTSSAVFSVNSDTEITATAPTGTGTVTVSVTNPAGTSSSSAGNAYTYLAIPPTLGPIVSSVSPPSGPASGGTDVTISGSRFTGATQVVFGAAAAASFTVLNDTTINAVSPSGINTVDVRVTTTDGTSPVVPEDQFTYFYSLPTLTSLSPASGPDDGGTTVILTGTNFIGASFVHFGSSSAVFSVNSDTEITATAPTGTGTVTVSVTNSAGTSSSSAGNAYTYLSIPPTLGPIVSSVSPSSGPASGGTDVTITGSRFTGATQVVFGAAAAASFTVLNDTTITAVSPSGINTVDVRVTTTEGTSPVVPEDQFTYFYSLPSVTSLSPASGFEDGGTTVIISGTNFTGATEVRFGASIVRFTLNSDTSITALSPPGRGTVDVSVTTPQGTSPFSPEDQFTYHVPPPPSPPSHFKGQFIKKRVDGNSCTYIKLSWQPSPDERVAGYLLYRNERLIANIPSDEPLVYYDYQVNKRQSYTYKLIAYTYDHRKSGPSSLTIGNSCMR